MVLLDLSTKGINGTEAEQALAAANITSNKNPVPFDNPKPAEWAGLRLGTAAATTRGFDEAAMQQVGELIANLIDAKADGTLDQVATTARAAVAELTARLPA